jgi:hypothetical protein
MPTTMLKDIITNYRKQTKNHRTFDNVKYVQIDEQYYINGLKTVYTNTCMIVLFDLQLNPSILVSHFYICMDWQILDNDLKYIKISN